MTRRMDRKKNASASRLYPLCQSGIAGFFEQAVWAAVREERKALALIRKTPPASRQQQTRPRGWSLGPGLVLSAMLLAGIHGAGTARASFPGMNGKVVFSSDLGCGGLGFPDIVVMNADGSGQTNLTNSPETDSSPTWSPDGTRIAFTTDLDFPHTRQIVSMDAGGRGRTGLVGGEFVGSSAWSPDGTRIAYSDDFGIFLMNADGSRKSPLTRNRGDGTEFDLAPDWSPDGTKIAFSRADGRGNGDIFAINADGSRETNLTNNVLARNSSPSWSPDGTRIAFSSYRSNFEIFVMNADGSGRTNLTNNPAADESPEWSPDGTKIVFTRGPRGRHDIFVMNADGSRQKNVTKSPADDGEPSWQVRPTALPPPPPPQRDCRVPNVLGQGLVTSRARIRRANCSVGRIRYARSVRARGRVLQQTPRPRLRLCRGARVKLVVSRGRK